jgi:hypothetical protein
VERTILFSERDHRLHHMVGTHVLAMKFCCPPIAEDKRPDCDNELAGIATPHAF